VLVVELPLGSRKLDMGESAQRELHTIRANIHTTFSLWLSAFASLGLCRYPPNDFQHCGAGIGLSEIGRATHSLGPGACFGTVVSRDENDGSVYALSGEALSEFNASHGTQLDVEHKDSQTEGASCPEGNDSAEGYMTG